MLTRDQERAQHAYQCIDSVIQSGDQLFSGYKILVYGLGPNIMRSGLSATVAFIQRYRDQDAAKALWRDIASAGIPNLPKDAEDIPKAIRNLSVDDYMLTTREVLKFSLWLKRAVQANNRKD